MTKIVWQVHPESDMAPADDRGKWFGGLIDSCDYAQSDSLDFKPYGCRQFDSASAAAAWFRSKSVNALNELRAICGPGFKRTVTFPGMPPVLQIQTLRAFAFALACEYRLRTCQR